MVWFVVIAMSYHLLLIEPDTEEAPASQRTLFSKIGDNTHVLKII